VGSSSGEGRGPVPRTGRAYRNEYGKSVYGDIRKRIGSPPGWLRLVGVVVMVVLSAAGCGTASGSSAKHCSGSVVTFDQTPEAILTTY